MKQRLKLGKRKFYFTPAKKYPNQDYRVVMFELLSDNNEFQGWFVFSYKDIEREIQEHLENENFNDKQLPRFPEAKKRAEKLKNFIDNLMKNMINKTI